MFLLSLFVFQLNSDLNGRLIRGSDFTGLNAPAQSDGSYYRVQLLSSGQFRIAKNIGGSFDSRNDFLTNADFQNMIQALYVTASAPGQNEHVSVTASVPEGYKFFCWLQSITTGWIGNCNPSTQLATTDFYTSVGSGGTLRCWYLVIKT